MTKSSARSPGRKKEKLMVSVPVREKNLNATMDIIAHHNSLFLSCDWKGLT